MRTGISLALWTPKLDSKGATKHDAAILESNFDVDAIEILTIIN